jgi:RNA polymerase sigma-70 factor (ECF subfamily)
MSTPLETLAARRPDFLAFVARRVGDGALAEDLVQTAFARAVEHAAELRDDDAVVAWFYRALRNAIVDRHRRRAAESRVLDELAAEIDDRVDAIEHRPASVCRCVLRVAESLKPEYVDALAAIEVDGTKVAAFADAAGISSGNAAVRVFRAREALRRGVLTACGACAKSGCQDCTCG